MSVAFEDELLGVAREAANAAADELRDRFGRRAAGVRVKSSPTDLVSDADLAAERAIRSVLAARRPGDAILGEEGGETGNGDLRWVVDPLDGTINFLFGIPVFAVSVACEDDQGALAGVVLDPIRDECFAACRSGDATLDGEPLLSPLRDDLAKAMLATGFNYDAAVRATQGAVLARILPRVGNLRRAGAAAIDLAWCAAGRFDAFYERGIKPWDFTAGALIASRAGLAVRWLEAVGPDEPSGVLVAPPAYVDELLALVLG